MKCKKVYVNQNYSNVTVTKLNNTNSNPPREKEINSQLSKEIIEQNKRIDELISYFKKFEAEIFNQVLNYISEQKIFNQELKKQIDNLSNHKNSYREFLKTLPPNYPVNNILVNGTLIKTSNFININPKNDIAYFLDKEILKAIDSNKIDSIEL